MEVSLGKLKAPLMSSESGIMKKECVAQRSVPIVEEVVPG